MVFVVCIKVNVQVMQCFWKHFYSLINFFGNQITIFSCKLGQNKIRRRNGKSLTASVVFLFMVGLLFYGWYFLLWSFHVGNIARDNTCYRFFAVFLGWYSQIATTFTLNWNFSVKFLFNRWHRAISYLKKLRNLTLSQYITELNPILIQYRTIPYLNTLWNYTLS